MKITEKQKVEDCFDGSSIYLWFLDRPWDRESIKALAALGTLEFFTEFPRPFFRLCGPNGLQVKGVEGDTQCRVIFPKKDFAELERVLEDQIRNQACENKFEIHR